MNRSMQSVRLLVICFAITISGAQAYAQGHGNGQNALIQALQQDAQNLQTSAAALEGDFHQLVTHIRVPNSNGSVLCVFEDNLRLLNVTTVYAGHLAAFQARAAAINNAELIGVGAALQGHLANFAGQLNAWRLTLEAGILPAISIQQLAGLNDSLNELHSASSCIRREIQTIRQGL